MTQQHHYQDMITLFDRCFYDDFNTRLIKGDDEPIIYPPMSIVTIIECFCTWILREYIT